MSSTPADTPPVTELPVYWFVRLELAVERGEFEGAAEAQRELCRLGITVRYDRPSSRRPEDARRAD